MKTASLGRVPLGGAWHHPLTPPAGVIILFWTLDPTLDPGGTRSGRHTLSRDEGVCWEGQRTFFCPDPDRDAEFERFLDAALVLHYMALALCSVVSGLSLIWALVCILREVRRKDEQSAGAGLEMVQSDAGLGPHDQRVHASLLSRDVMLLRCSWLRSRPRGYVLPRRQDLPPEALFPPEEAAALFARQDRSACALTYGCAPRPATPRPALPLPCPRASHNHDIAR